MNKYLAYTVVFLGLSIWFYGTWQYSTPNKNDQRMIKLEKAVWELERVQAKQTYQIKYVLKEVKK